MPPSQPPPASAGSSPPRAPSPSRPTGTRSPIRPTRPSPPRTCGSPRATAAEARHIRPGRVRRWRAGHRHQGQPRQPGPAVHRRRRLPHRGVGAPDLRASRRRTRGRPPRPVLPRRRHRPGLPPPALGGNDFVSHLPNYSYEDVAGTFTIARDKKEILPLLRDALKINPDIEIMASPWSAPGWMKKSGRLEGGRLLPEHYQDYADYLVDAIEAYKKEGVPIQDLTVVNEPLFEAIYPPWRCPRASRCSSSACWTGR
ncbi:hypothetical protein NKH77_54725 [Streptomyces sp. M19]